MKILDYDDVKRLKEKAEKSEDVYIPVSCFMLLKFFQEIELLEKEADWLAEELASVYKSEFELTMDLLDASGWREAARKAVKGAASV